MKILTKYNRVTRQEYVLSTADLKEAVVAYIAMRLGLADPPANARVEIALEFGDSHEEAAILTRRFIYDDEEESASPVSQPEPRAETPEP